jgi:hypothetical protein
MASDPLGTYLQDHLAGATAGVARARRVARVLPGEAGRELDAVAGEVAADRETLRSLMRALGVRESRAKNAMAWAGEKLSRLKPNGRLRGEPLMQRLHDLEVLSLGIAGKAALWEALRSVPAVAATPLDLDDLAERVRDQRRCVERARLTAA